jgi:LysM repeat protein
MFKKSLIYLTILLFSSETLLAKRVIDCRVMTKDMTECNPYGKRLHFVKEVSYDNEHQKLILVKRLSKAKKEHFTKVISVKDMVSEYIYFEDSLRPKEDQKESEIKHDRSRDGDDIRVKIIDLKPDRKPGYYTVVKGDSLSKIAKKLGTKISQLKKLNGLKNSTTLQIGQKIKTPFEQRAVDALVRTEYTVQEGDTLLSIAKMFKLPAKDIVTLNHITNATTVQEGKVLKLPIPYILDRLDRMQETEGESSGNILDINAFGTHKLRVTATAYTSHNNQTDDTPFLAAWNNKLRPGMKVIAVSRDLLDRFGMRNGTKVRISGLKGLYRVRDKMNKRYKKRIDIYMGLDLKSAYKWGKRSVMIYW